MKYETVIGLEVHAQLLTRSKMYCRCSSEYAAAPPNTHVCQVCLGMPGVLPTINRRAIECTIMTALALGCSIPGFTKFDRKNYSYPDLMKGYQISQYDAPIGVDGYMNLDVDGESVRVGIKRVHLEEDVAKLVHRTGSWGDSYSLMDVNRAGVPLMEVVGEPDLKSPEEARQYLMKLHAILQYLGVSTANMEEGSFRCDANISIKPEGARNTLAKIEVKNMNSFRAVYRALEYEAKRQREVVAEGGQLVQETRGWVEEKEITVSQRSKEYAHDYRYFPEPDLPPLMLSSTLVDSIRASLPELPEAKRERFMTQHGLPTYDAALLCGSKALADYFEACLDASESMQIENKPKIVSNWLLGDFSRLLNQRGIEIDHAQVSPDNLIGLLDLIQQGKVSGPTAKAVFEEMFETGKPAEDIVSKKGLTQISDIDAVESVVKRVIADNSEAVADFKAGKQKSLTFLTGQVMRATKGRANPKVVNEVLKKELGEAG